MSHPAPVRSVTTQPGEVASSRDRQDGLRWPGPDAPFYLPTGDEIDVFETAHQRGLPVMLKGPTGCGKTRFVDHMAWRLGRPIVTLACHDDLSARAISRAGT